MRFRPPRGVTRRGLPLLIVPSMINRWYIVDLRPGASMVAALLDSGLDVFCLDWGVPGDEDRYLTWTDVVARVSRAVRRTMRETGAPKVGVLGYCMGGTLTAIHTALEPQTIAALVNLAGPVDFSHGGTLAHMTNPRWFDPEAMVAPGNLSRLQMQSGFVSLRPVAQLSKWVGLADRLFDNERREEFFVLENWANDNIDFPGAAYQRYIKDLYQNNELVRGEHRVAGRRVDLSDIHCPVLVITAKADHICPPAAATALATHASSDDTRIYEAPGGHVGCVVGSTARAKLYPELCEWLGARLGKVLSVRNRLPPSAAPPAEQPV
jgi:polyhydroxyalkanoate synthase